MFSIHGNRNYTYRLSLRMLSVSFQGPERAAGNEKADSSDLSKIKETILSSEISKCAQSARFKYTKQLSLAAYSDLLPLFYMTRAPRFMIDN